MPSPGGSTTSAAGSPACDGTSPRHLLWHRPVNGTWSRLGPSCRCAGGSRLERADPYSSFFFFLFFKYESGLICFSSSIIAAQVWRAKRMHRCTLSLLSEAQIKTPGRAQQQGAGGGGGEGVRTHNAETKTKKLQNPALRRVFLVSVNLGSLPQAPSSSFRCWWC